MAWDTLSLRIDVSQEAAGLAIIPLFAQLLGQPPLSGRKAELAGAMEDSLNTHILGTDSIGLGWVKYLACD